MSDNFYCAAPWRGLHINPRGDVKTCCAGNPNMLGNLNTNNIIEILNSDLMTEIRSEMSQGRAHKYCSNCVQAERFGADSERMFFDQALRNYAAVTQSNPVMAKKFATHIHEIETKYHPDQAGQFAKLWPELNIIIG